jgi:hypothetical protein
MQLLHSNKVFFMPALNLFKSIMLLCSVAVSFCCSQAFVNSANGVNVSLIQTSGKTLEERIEVPEGFSRLAADSNSFAYFLRHINLKPDSAKVLLYNGKVKPIDVHVAVLDVDCGKQDLQQCADACIRLRAEYLWKTKQWNKIHFNLTNGFNMEYSKWHDGNRLVVQGNYTSWSKSAEPSNSYQTFRSYLNKVFTYAGTLSVEKEINRTTLKDLQPGDVFVIGGSPGHAAMVADVAVNQTGEKIFLLAQGYMPAQDIHIIKNPNQPEMSPWFGLHDGEALKTLEWTFNTYTLGRF